MQRLRRHGKAASPRIGEPCGESAHLARKASLPFWISQVEPTRSWTEMESLPMRRTCNNGATLYVVGTYANTSCNGSGATAKPHLPELANQTGNRRTLASTNYSPRSLLSRCRADGRHSGVSCNPEARPPHPFTEDDGSRKPSVSITDVRNLISGRKLRRRCFKKR